IQQLREILLLFGRVKLGDRRANAAHRIRERSDRLSTTRIEEMAGPLGLGNGRKPLFSDLLLYDSGRRCRNRIRVVTQMSEERDGISNFTLTRQQVGIE